MVSAKHAFWQALVFTLIIFFIGLMFGFFIENYRGNQMEAKLFGSEISLLDEQLREKSISDFNVSCTDATKDTFAFADRIYLEAQQLEKYDSASILSDNLKVVHQRYDLLRFMLWTESSALKNRCSSDYETVVYFYDYASDDVNTQALQSVYAKMLTRLKNEEPDRVLLIPIASNLNLNSISLAANAHGVVSYPSMLINDRVVINSSVSYEELRNAALNE